MATPTPLTIKSASTLRVHMGRLESEATAETTMDNNKIVTRARINKRNVECRSTYTTKHGFYVLFYVDNKRTARTNLPAALGIKVEG